MKILLILAATVGMVACGGRNGPFTPTQSSPPPSTPSLTGQWELLATSSQGQDGELIETSLQSAGTNQYSDAGEEPYLTSGGTLGRNAIGQCSLANISVTISGDAVQYAIGGTNVTGSGTYSSQVITGTYTQPNPCPDNGTFAATQITPLSGTYDGNLLFVDGNLDSVSATFSSSPTNLNSGLSANVQVSGTDNGSSSLGGFQAGALFSLGGMFNGTTVAYSGFLVTSSNAVFFPNASVGDLVVYEGSGVPFCNGECGTSEPSFIGVLVKQ
jgi:hypothetical protein